MAAPKEPRGRHRKFSDSQLAEAIGRGLSTAEIAEKFGCTPSAVYARMDQRQRALVAATVQPEEARRCVVEVLDEVDRLLHTCMERVVKLQDACERYLLDPDQPDRYDVGPRAGDVEVIYWKKDDDGRRIGRRPERDNLQYLLDLALGDDDVERVSFKHTDPRALILQTVDRIESVLKTALELTDRVSGRRLVEAWVSEFKAFLDKQDPEFARAVAQAVRRELALGASFRDRGALPAQSGGDGARGDDGSLPAAGAPPG